MIVVYDKTLAVRLNWIAHSVPFQFAVCSHHHNGTFHFSVSISLALSLAHSLFAHANTEIICGLFVYFQALIESFYAFYLRLHRYYCDTLRSLHLALSLNSCRMLTRIRDKRSFSSFPCASWIFFQQQFRYIFSTASSIFLFLIIYVDFVVLPFRSCWLRCCRSNNNTFYFPFKCDCLCWCYYFSSFFFLHSK